MSKSKKCITCKEWKDESSFNKDSSQKDGHCGRCYLCSREQWHEEHEYQVVHDPWELFAKGSSFRYPAIKDMLKNEYLSPGTRFRRGKYEYEVSEKMKWVRI